MHVRIQDSRAILNFYIFVYSEVDQTLRLTVTALVKPVNTYLYRQLFIVNKHPHGDNFDVQNHTAALQLQIGEGENPPPCHT